MNDEKIAQGLGWFSLTLGFYELVAGRELAEWLGLENGAPLVRFYGAREVGAGAGLLAGKTKLAPWLWARIGGDVLDVATLVYAMRSANPKRRNAFIAFAAIGIIPILDVWCARNLSKRGK